MESNTARNFALQLGALASLYLSLSFLLVLLFGIINLAFPDATEGYWQVSSSQSSVRLGIAMVVVFFPTYLILTRRVNNIRRKEREGAYLTLTKWLIYLSLLVSGGVLLGDLVAVIMSFLEGDITTRFVLKALSVLIVIGAAFYYYIRDARGFWIENEKTSVTYGTITAAIVLATIVLGFFHIDSPSTVRMYELDARQISDLQDMQYRIEDYARVNNMLPASISEVYVGIPAPTAPEGRPAYTYNQTDKGFELCATFAQNATDEFSNSYARPVMDNDTIIKNLNNWDYKSGRYCFQRITNFKTNTTTE